MNFKISQSPSSQRKKAGTSKKGIEEEGEAEGGRNSRHFLGRKGKGERRSSGSQEKKGRESQDSKESQDSSEFQDSSELPANKGLPDNKGLRDRSESEPTASRDSGEDNSDRQSGVYGRSKENSTKRTNYR
jgi:hypothetical protein